MKSLTIAAVLAVLVGSSFAVAPATPRQSHVFTQNFTNDASIWVSAFDGPVDKGEWCVGPGQIIQHRIEGVVRRVRFQVTNNPDCHHPIVLDTDLYAGPANTLTFVVTKSKSGHYAIHMK